MTREDDSISREEVLQMIDNIREAGGFIGYNTYSEAFDQVCDMSSVPRWIPVSEKLPDPFTLVNATCRSLVDDRENWVIETVYCPIPEGVNKDNYSDWGNIPMLNWGEAEVIAWVKRIVPKPYKAESEDKE